MDGLLALHGVYARSVAPGMHVDNSLVDAVVLRIDGGDVPPLPVGPGHSLDRRPIGSTKR